MASFRRLSVIPRVVLVAAGLLAPLQPARALFIELEGPPNLVTISDNGPGDLDPSLGIIKFNEFLRFQQPGTGSTIIEMSGTLQRIPGVPIPGGMTNFGIKLTRFVAKVAFDEPGVQIVPALFVNAEDTFRPGIPAPDFGVVSDHIDGILVFKNAPARTRSFVTDLATWTGVPPVSAGHAEIPLINPGGPPGPHPVRFSLPDVTSPSASGARGLEFVHYQLNIPGCINHGEPCSEFDLPTSGIALVVQEPGTAALLLPALIFLAGALSRGKRASALPE